MTWVSKQEYRESAAGRIGLSINSAFLREIKEDHVAFRQLLEECLLYATATPHPSVRVLTQRLRDLSDELETYFALEEFYGYLPTAVDSDSAVSNRAHLLKKEHELLFLELNSIVDLCERALYGEATWEKSLPLLQGRFGDFYRRLARHEQDEHELLILATNQDIGVGD